MALAATATVTALTVAGGGGFTSVYRSCVCYAVEKPYFSFCAIFRYLRFVYCEKIMSGYRKVNYYELCRLCTSSEGNKMNIFRDEGRRRQLQTKIQTYLPIQVSIHV